MSIILDALKKMEGEGPEKGPAARLSTSESPLPAGKRLLILSLAAAALSLNLFAVVLWLGMREGPDERGASEMAKIPVSKRPAAAPQRTSPLAAPVSVVERPALSRLPAGSAPPPAPVPGYDDEGPATTMGGEEPSSLSVPPTAAESPPGGSPPTRAVGTPAATPPLPLPDREIPPRGEGAAAEGVNAADQQEYDGSVLTVQELPENLRAGVKDLKITAHVYSDDPVFRRVAVNDTLKREGDVVADGLVVEDITEEGAVFSYRGRLFKMESR
jgi:general secretion pathway protein B